ncbi:helix-turn-helix domain-containing protein [Streptosporangium sp. NPDC004631]
MTRTNLRERLYTREEVAAAYRVSPRTVTRWAAEGRVESTRTPGGHYRFPESVIDGRDPRKENGPGRCATTERAL